MESMIDAKAEDYNKIIEFANKKNVIMLAFIGSYAPKRHNPSFSASASMNIKDEFGVEKILNEIKDKKQDYKNQKVYFLINSMGGSLSSAYKIARAIRLSFNDITVFIPHYALSGGTLLSLIGDDIRMGIMSQTRSIRYSIAIQ
jgi:ClpP class serine protease